MGSALSGETVFATAAEVGRFVKDYSLSRRGFKKSPGIFEEILYFLRQKQIEYENAEQQMYNIFGVSGLKQLQERVEEVNDSGLIKFSNEYLRRANSELMKNLREVSNEELIQAAAEYLEEHIFTLDQKDNIKFNSAEAIAEGLVEAPLLNILKESRQVSNAVFDKKHKTERIQRGKGYKILARNIAEYIKNPTTKQHFKMSKAYKGDLTAFLTEAKYLQDKSTFTLEIPSQELDGITDSILGNDLNYYPYFMLSNAQMEEAVTGQQGKIVWQHFKKHIAEVSGMDMGVVNNILDQLGPEAFFQRSINGVVGILGEVQMLFIVSKLTAGRQVEMVASGPLKNLAKIDKPELGADLLLNKTLGIQVKNYRFINNSLFQIQKNFKWGYLEKVLSDSPYLIEMGKYYGAVCYNQVINKSIIAKFGEESVNRWEQYKALYEQKLNRRTGDLNVATQGYLMSNIDRFLTFQEAYQIIYDSPQLQATVEQGATYKNAFYFFGGSTVVPVSYIIRLLISRFEKMLKELQSKEYNALGTFYVTSSYAGDEKYLYGGDNNDPVSNILSSITFNLTLNLKINDLQLDNGGVNVAHMKN